MAPAKRPIKPKIIPKIVMGKAGRKKPISQVVDKVKKDARAKNIKTSGPLWRILADLSLADSTNYSRENARLKLLYSNRDGGMSYADALANTRHQLALFDRYLAGERKKGIEGWT